MQNYFLLVQRILRGMRGILLSLIAIVVMLVSVPALAETPSSDSDKPIIVKSSSPIATVKLTSNRTTGYSWFLGIYDNSMVKPLTQKYIAPKDTVPGAAGQSIWTFRLDASAFTVPQIIKITLIYARPWDTLDARTKVITFITQK